MKRIAVRSCVTHFHLTTLANSRAFKARWQSNLFSIALTFTLAISGCFSSKILASAPDYPTSRITIIIDDLGNNMILGRRSLELPGEVSYAILPHTPGAIEFAHRAHERGRDVILHTPMESEHAAKLGPGGLTMEMDKEDFMDTFQSNLDAIPFIVGVNNHMGSLLTQHQVPMNWIMAELRKRRLFFIDSRTSPYSVARKVAFKKQIPSLTRDVFLDHDQSLEAIDLAFEKLIRIARWQGYAIGIGHPYPNTLAYLEQQIPKLESRNIKLVSASKMISSPGYRHHYFTLIRTVRELPIPDKQREWAF